MKKSAIITIIVAVCLIVFGFAIVFSVFASQGFDYSFLNYNILKKQSVDYVTTTRNVTDKFDSVNIDETFADVSLILTDDEAYVESFHSDSIYYDVYVENSVLNIIKHETSSLNVGVSFSTPDSYLRVYLPEKDYKNLYIDATSSDIFINTDLSFENADIHSTSGEIELVSLVKNSLKLDTTSGDITLRNVDCESISAFSNSGEIEIEDAKVKNDINLKTTSGCVSLENIFPCETINAKSTSGGFTASNVVATKFFSVQTTSSTVELNDSDCENISIESTSGDIYGQLLSKKVFVTNTSSGNVSIDSQLYGDTGHFSASTTSGDIKLTLSDQSEQ